MVVPAVVANAEAGSCCDHQCWGWSQPPTQGWGLSRPPAHHDRQCWGWGVLRPSMLGLGMAVVVISAGAFKKRKKEIRTYLPGAQHHAQTKRMDSSSVLKSSPVQSFCPNFRQLATGLVAKFLKTRQLATELVFGIHWVIICHERCIKWSICGVDVLH